jgi:hypothetical protein
MDLKKILLVIVTLFIFYKFIYQKGYIIYTIHWHINKYEKLFDKLRKSQNMIEFQEISEKIYKLKGLLVKKYSKKQISDAVKIRKDLAHKLDINFYKTKLNLMKY